MLDTATWTRAGELGRGAAAVDVERAPGHARPLSSAAASPQATPVHAPVHAAVLRAVLRGGRVERLAQRAAHLPARPPVVADEPAHHEAERQRVPGQG